MRLWLFCFLSQIVLLSGLLADDDPRNKRWNVLMRPLRTARGVRPIPAQFPIRPLGELQFTGPMPAHPFVLGNFAADGTWKLVNGGIQRTQGYNAALRFIEQADQFELEGRMAMKGLGGWFLLFGWNEELGNGYAVHNCTMKESGSPWFMTEFRGGSAVEGTNQQIRQFEWKRTQNFKVVLKDNRLRFEVGRIKVIESEPLENYQPGAIIFGVYDTKYGPKPVRLESLRIREASGAAPAAGG